MKKILFVIDSLHCAGAEKSLISLLQLIDYSKYEVDLQLFDYGGILEEFLPKEVNLLPSLKYFKKVKLSLKELLKDCVKSRDFKYFKSRVIFSCLLRVKNYTHKEQARLFWKTTQKCFFSKDKMYDIAIAYAQGVPTFYVADRVRANRKFTWVNVSYELIGKEREYQKSKYEKFNKIVTVSHSAEEIFKEVFPEFKNKMEIMYDINNPKIINNMSEIGKKFPRQESKEYLRFLTIGRLANQKGYDIALKACKILKDRGINFKWYVLGKGPLKNEIESTIKELGLEENFILLGVTSNPYGYIKDSDIYIQTSKFEGFGLAIAEARILNVPVVTTEFDAVYNQMVQRKNGIVTQMDGESVANGVLELIENSDLRLNIIEYLKNEKKGNLEEFNKFIKLIEE